MHRGYIKLWRKSLDSGMLRNHELWAFWCWCLIKASHKEMSQLVGLQKLRILPGQFVFGRRKAAQELKLHESRIFRMLKWLETEQQINIQANNKYSIITIVNWGIYQSEELSSEQQIEQHNEHQMNNKRTTSEQQANTNKNDKNGKNEKKEYSSAFLLFWDAYPKKIDKPRAWQAWKKHNGSLPPIETILSSLTTQCGSDQWQKDGGQFIPHPSTWINGERWADNTKIAQESSLEQWRRNKEAELRAQGREDEI